MSPRMEKVDFPGIIIIGSRHEGLLAANYIKSKTKLKYIIFLIDQVTPKGGEHTKKLKLKEKVTSAQMNLKMDKWVVITEKKEDSVILTEYTCEGVIIATVDSHYVPNWFKERIRFDAMNKEGFRDGDVHYSHYLGTHRICSIGFEEDNTPYRIKGSFEISHKKIDGEIIVGAGPAGLAAAASFDTRGREYMIIEKSNCIAPLWQYHTYVNLTLQRPKEKCQLTNTPFPEDCPAYPTRDDFLKYLDDTAKKLKVKPQFNEEVTEAYYEEHISEDHGDNSFWVVRTIKSVLNKDEKFERSEYECKGLVVASGRDARPRVPKFVGLKRHFPNEKTADTFKMQIHSSEYKNGKIYKGKKVLVVGYGDSAIDICGDLHNHEAKPYIVVRESQRSRMVYKLAKFFPGKEHPGTFPLKLNLSLLSVLADNFGQCENGIINPKEEIEIEVYPDIEEFRSGSVKFKNIDTAVPIDCVILATGYNDNVQLWCQHEKIFTHKEGRTVRELQLEESIQNGVIRIGFTKDGLSGIKGQAKIAAMFGENEAWWR